MGGNARAINRETGGTLEFRGREAKADKVDLRTIDRQVFKRDFLKVFQRLDDLHRKMFGDPIWDPKTRDSLLKSGDAFNGSSEHLFGDKVNDAEFLKYKPLVGDIDLTVPAEKIGSIFDLLTGLEGSAITDTVQYVGQNKTEQEGHQINSLFAYTFSPRLEPVLVQIDFEAVDYQKGKPSEFAKFGHSSSWNDVTAGVKGVFHKYLLRSLAKGASTRSDIVILTPASPLTPPEKIKVKKMTSPAHLLSFSVDRGIRANAEQQFLPDGTPVLVNDKPAFKELPTNTSEYKRTRREIFTLIFGHDPQPDELTQLDSFMGILELMLTYLNPTQIEDIFLDFTFDKLYQTGAKGQQVSQGLSATSPEEDRGAKDAAVKKFIETFPHLSKHMKAVEKQKESYYSVYKVRQNAFESFIRSYIKSLLRS